MWKGRNSISRLTRLSNTAEKKGCRQEHSDTTGQWRFMDLCALERRQNLLYRTVEPLDTSGCLSIFVQPSKNINGRARHQKSLPCPRFMRISCVLRRCQNGASAVLLFDSGTLSLQDSFLHLLTHLCLTDSHLSIKKVPICLWINSLCVCSGVHWKKKKIKDIQLPLPNVKQLAGT